MNKINPSFYLTNSAIVATRACYVKRKADQELFQSLYGRKHTFILSSPKVGKSSLLEYAFHELQNVGFYVAQHDLNTTSRNVGDEKIEAENGFQSLITNLVQNAQDRNGLKMAPNWLHWWKEQAELPVSQRFVDFLRIFFLEPSTQPWVIAIDQIDAVIPLPFSDDFFAAIRDCQNARTTNPLFDRLTFLLVGVVNPTQLVNDNGRAPFNIGHLVKVTDFTAEEAKILLTGLGEKNKVDHPALQQVLHWTNGHPYLTHQAFYELAKKMNNTPQINPQWDNLVDQTINKIFLHSDARENDPHLRDIARCLIGHLDQPSNPHVNPKLKHQMLGLYQDVLEGKFVKDQTLSDPIAELKLCGLLVPSQENPAKLAIRNRVYRKVFDLAWARPKTSRNNWKQIAAAAFLLVTLLASGLFFLQRQIKNVPTTTITKLQGRYRPERVQQLLADYWTHEAQLASSQRPRDEAAILWLTTLGTQESPESRFQTRNVLSGSLSHILTTFRHAKPVRYAEFSPDGHRVVTTCSDEIARIWDADTGKPIGNPLQHNNVINHAKYSPDGRRIVTSSNDGAARIWDADSGQLLGNPLKHNGPVHHAEFSADGRRVVTTSSDRTAKIWDTDTGNPVGNPLQHTTPVLHAEFSSDGRHIVTTSDNGAARIWDANSGQALGNPLVHSGSVNHVKFSPDGSRVVTASSDKTARIWDVDSGKPLGSPLQHDGSVRYAKFSADGRRVVTTSDDKTARIWDADSCAPLGDPLQHNEQVHNAEFSADGRHVVTASSDGTARIWDANTGQPLGSPLQHDGFVHHAKFSADGRRVITASADKTARIWEVAPDKPVGVVLQHKHPVNRAEFSADGRRVITISSDDNARIWDTDSGKLLGSLLQNNHNINRAKFSPDGSRVVTASSDKTARIWDVASSKPLGNPLRHVDPVVHAEFSADGSRVVTASGDSVRIWDADSGSLLGKPLRHVGPVHYAKFSADGKHLVTATMHALAVIWNIDSGEPSDPLQHNNTINHAEFSADGRLVVTACSNQEVRIWQANSGKPLGNPLQHLGAVDHAQFSADGHDILTQTGQTVTWYKGNSIGVWQPQTTVWTNGANWVSSPLLKTPTGESIRVVEFWTKNTLFIRDISLHQSDNNLPDLPSPPAELLQTYLKRFALEFADDQKTPTLRPTFPIGSASSSNKRQRRN